MFLLALPDPVLWLIAAVSILLLTLVILMAIRAHREKVVTGEEALIGSEATVLEWASQHGEVHTWGERWAAKSNTPLELKKNDTVYVTGKKNLVLTISNIQPIGE